MSIYKRIKLSPKDRQDLVLKIRKLEKSYAANHDLNQLEVDLQRNLSPRKTGLPEALIQSPSLEKNWQAIQAKISENNLTLEANKENQSSIKTKRIGPRTYLKALSGIAAALALTMFTSDIVNQHLDKGEIVDPYLTPKGSLSISNGPVCTFLLRGPSGTMPIEGRTIHITRGDLYVIGFCDQRATLHLNILNSISHKIGYKNLVIPIGDKPKAIRTQTNNLFKISDLKDPKQIEFIVTNQEISTADDLDQSIQTGEAKVIWQMSYDLRRKEP